MEAIDILAVLRRHVLLILTLTILTPIIGYGISFIPALIPEKYDASAIVMVRPSPLPVMVFDIKLLNGPRAPAREGGSGHVLK